MQIRLFKPEDSRLLERLFFNTIRTINLGDYTPEQVAVWAPEGRDLAAWDRSFENKFVVVAEDGQNLFGFGELEANRQ